MEQYRIYPVKGKDAQAYLLRLGCLIGPLLMDLPDHFEVMSKTTHDGMRYVVMCKKKEVFTLQYYPTNRCRVIVPAKYQISFSELLKSYSINEFLAEGIIGSHGAVFQLMRNIPIHRTMAITALRRLSDYTGHYYDLENVHVLLLETSEA
jgi:hypothetical protein